MLLIKLFCKNCGGHVAESRMPTLTIVEDFDVLGDLADRLLPGFVTSVGDEFIF